MKVYMFLVVAILLSLCLKKIFAFEYSRAEEKSKYERIMDILSDIFLVLAIILSIGFYIYNIYIFKAKYSQLTSQLAILFIIIMPALLISIVLLESEKIKYLNILKDIFGYLFMVVGLIGLGLYLIVFIAIIFDGNSTAIKDSEKKYKEYSYSIEIVEMEKVPYTNISGSRWYIKSAPSIAYYYDVITKNGNQTTKILDGSKYYVEKDEDNKYIDNPHIEVYEIVRKYTNLYGKEKEDFVTYEYTICVPENSIYYEGE